MMCEWHLINGINKEEKKDSRDANRYLQTCVQSSTVHTSQEVGTTQVPMRA